MNADDLMSFADALDPPITGAQAVRIVIGDRLASALCLHLIWVQRGESKVRLFPGDREKLGLDETDEGLLLIRKLIEMFAIRLRELELDMGHLFPSLTSWLERNPA